MTTKELIEVVESISLAGMPIPTTIGAVMDGTGVRITAQIKTLDRNTGFPTNIYNVSILSSESIETLNQGDALDMCRCQLRGVLEHELDEHLMVDGFRMYDPHERERK